MDTPTPRAYTEEELTNKLMNHIRAVVHFWGTQVPDQTQLDLCEGVAFSILTLLDGDTLSLPHATIVFDPHPEDKQYHISQGENWVEPGTTISTCLHEQFYQ